MQASKGGGAQTLLQNPKVQIGVIAAAALTLIVVVFFLFFANRGGPSAGAPQGYGAIDPATGMPMGMNGPGMDLPPGMDGGNGPGSLMPGGMPGMAGDFGTGDPSGGFGFGQPQGAAVEEMPKSANPGVPVRKNPYLPNTELTEVIKSVPDLSGPPDLAQAHGLYAELNPPVPAATVSTDDLEGPPVPPMRVAGIVVGQQVSAILQMGTQHLQVTPGAMIPKEDPVFRVERIEKDKVLLTRRWEFGSRKGTQRIEVPLIGSPTQQAGGFAPGGIAPGGFGAPGGNGPS